MRGIRKWMLSLFYFIPIIWFMYVSVELMAERSSSLAALELAYRLQQQQNARKDSAPNNALPAEALQRHAFNELMDKMLRDGGAGRQGGRVDLSGQDPEVVEFQEKLRRYKELREARLDAERLGEKREEDVVLDDVARLKKIGERGALERNVVDGVLPGQVGKEEEETVQFPQYVEAWSPDFPGEGGKAVTINVTKLTAEERRRYDEGWAHNSFNQYASDIISVHRSLPDDNPPECHEQRKEYSQQLPQVSVIIIFHNEAWSVLLRSVHSVLSRTPAHLLRQIILVDDLSSMDHLKRPLEVYWRREPKVSIVRSPKRVGLTQARLLGYRAATAEVLVFLDSHIECFPGWVEPLINRVLEAPSAAVYPQIDPILATNFRVMQNKDVKTRGIFRWTDLNFQWGFLDSLEQRSRQAASPIRVPCGK